MSNKRKGHGMANQRRDDELAAAGRRAFDPIRAREIAAHNNAIERARLGLPPYPEETTE